MKNFLIVWIIFQLVIIGSAGGSGLVEIKERNCKTPPLIETLGRMSNFKIQLVSFIFPLMFFLSDEDVCKKHVPVHNFPTLK